MTQVSPTTTLSDQAAISLQELNESYKVGAITDIDTIATLIRKAITSFNRSAGEPVTEYDPVRTGEPPSSAKMNKFMDTVQHDIFLMRRQNDFLRSSILYLNNVMVTELGQAKLENGRIRNKLKTLELYSSDTDPTIMSFVETFSSDDFIDMETVGVGQAAAIMQDSFLTLGRDAEQLNLASGSKVTVLPSSNGFNGNNIEATASAAVNNDDEDNPITVTFLSEVKTVDDVSTIVDSDRYSWFEYSAYYVDPSHVSSAGSMNFAYEDPSDGSLIPWHVGPLSLGDRADPSQGLFLGLEVELKEITMINQVTYDPYGMDNNSNHPVEVVRIQTSEDGTNWDEVSSSNTWVATNQNVQSMRASENISIGTTAWSFQPRLAKFIRIFTRQKHTMDIVAGHVYFVNPDNQQERVQGPVAPIGDPNRFNDYAELARGDMLQKREVFPAKRWGIGIRELGIGQIQYKLESIIISQPIRVAGVVDRISLDAETYIPPDYNEETLWVQYHISGDNGVTWHQISRVTDNHMGIPEIIAFNDPTPAGFREPGVEYVNTESPVESLRVKIVLTRPSALRWSTPIVRSYSLRIKKK